jgi:hypothetical protein
MKTKQEKKEMISRSIYMPKELWDRVDEKAEKEDLSANQVVRKLVVKGIPAKRNRLVHPSSQEN